MKLTFLGTGTSFGIPVVGCDCATCTSTEFPFCSRVQLPASRPSMIKWCG